MFEWRAKKISVAKRVIYYLSMTFVPQAMWLFCLHAHFASVAAIAGYLEVILLPSSTWIALLSPCSYHRSCSYWLVM